MFTINEFSSEWQRLHHPSMSVKDDVAFYYQAYGRLRGLAGQDACCLNESDILSLLLYVENTVAVGLDGVYEYMYRSVGDVVFRWCDGLGLRANAASQVHNLVSEVVAEAPHSSLRRWMTENVLSCDFNRLNEMLTWSARKDKILRRIYPDLRYRETMFLRLTGDRQTARQMLWSDMAFNWRDKQGVSLPGTLAKRFRLLAVSAVGQEKSMLLEVADNLDSIHSERPDTYTLIERKNEYTVFLCHRDGRLFDDVIFPSPLAEANQRKGLAAQLVTYLDKTYLNGAVCWLDVDNADAWDRDAVWNAIEKEEREDAKHTFFTTPFGRPISRYEDLYTLPEDPEEACLAGQGIYLDEPNVFDILKC